jgi:hypothetical protein
VSRATASRREPRRTKPALVGSCISTGSSATPRAELMPAARVAGGYADQYRRMSVRPASASTLTCRPQSAQARHRPHRVHAV